MSLGWIIRSTVMYVQ